MDHFISYPQIRALAKSKQLFRPLEFPYPPSLPLPCPSLTPSLPLPKQSLTHPLHVPYPKEIHRVHSKNQDIKVLLSGALQSDLRDPKCWHNSYIILRIGFMKKKMKNFFHFFHFFSSFLDTLYTQKIFLHCWAKNNLLLYTCPFDPQKILCRGLFYKVSLKCPEPVQGRVKRFQCNSSNVILILHYTVIF